MKESDTIWELKEFLSHGATPYHATEHAEDIFLSYDFQALSPREEWHLKPGKGYVCRPLPTALFAFSIGEHLSPDSSTRIAAAHTDSPCLKIKPNPTMTQEKYVRLNTEVYGGPILSTFFDRPLALAGRILLRRGKGLRPEPVDVFWPENKLVLPNLAPHMPGGLGEEGHKIDRQRELLPLLGAPAGLPGNQRDFVGFLAEKLKVAAEAILDFDLSLVVPDEPVTVGWQEEWMLSPRLDDLTSVSAAVHTLVRTELSRSDRIQMVMLFDNEEIGSLTNQGASGILPSAILRKLWQGLGRSGEDCLLSLANGILLSMDVAHAYHPGYPSPYDPINRPCLGDGVFLKSAVNQSYLWNPQPMAEIIALAEERHVPYRRFTKESNIRGGGTIGSRLSSALGIPGVDLGIGLLAMHSACELGAYADQEALESLMEGFFDCY